MTCSIRPPSQEFQFRVIVNTTVAASSTTSSGVPYFCQFGFACAGTCSGSEVRAGASAGFTVSVAIELAACGAIFHLLSICGEGKSTRCAVPRSKHSHIAFAMPDRILKIERFSLFNGLNPSDFFGGGFVL